MIETKIGNPAFALRLLRRAGRQRSGQGSRRQRIAVPEPGCRGLPFISSSGSLTSGLRTKPALCPNGRKLNNRLSTLNIDFPSRLKRVV
jgi:hypothetical protein